ncbi:MAG: universal stress protein [Anaerolineae bacterium]|jgi:nucleotide-binding universal stress UspA family protein
MASQILVPLDGSALAEQALPYAMTLARGLPAELVLFRSVSLPSDVKGILDDTADEPLEQLETEANDYLRKVAGQFEEAGLRAYAVVRHRPAAEAIVDYSNQADIRQIVMSTHGYSGISRWRHGSVAERVLQSANVPVLLVRAQRSKDAAPVPACRRILVPLDGSALAEQVLPPVVALAQAFDAEMVLFQVAIVHTSGSFTGEWYLPLQGILETARQDAQAYLNRVADSLKGDGFKVSTAMRVGAVADSIVDHAQINHIDLIAMCTHGRTGLARWTLGSVADRVLRAGHVPLLLVRAR